MDVNDRGHRLRNILARRRVLLTASCCLRSLLSLRDHGKKCIGGTKWNEASHWKEHNTLFELSEPAEILSKDPPMNSSGKFSQLHLDITISVPSRSPIIQSNPNFLLMTEYFQKNFPLVHRGILIVVSMVSSPIFFRFCFYK